MDNTVDADKMFVELLGEIPWSSRWASDRCKELDGGGGIAKRLLAALHSAETRGLGRTDWKIVPDDVCTETENGASDEVTRAGTFTVWSTSGHWSGRPWHITARTIMGMDQFGCEVISPELVDGTFDIVPGTIVVGSRYGDDHTTFTGTCVAQFAIQILRRCMVHRACSDAIIGSCSGLRPGVAFAAICDLVSNLGYLPGATNAQSDVIRLLPVFASNVDLANSVIRKLHLLWCLPEGNNAYHNWGAQGAIPEDYTDTVIAPWLDKSKFYNGENLIDQTLTRMANEDKSNSPVTAEDIFGA